MPAMQTRSSPSPRCPRPRAGSGFHQDPEWTKQITNVRWIVLHVIEETAVHSGHRGHRHANYPTGKTRLGGR